jgi:hypothetical protein
MPLTDLLRTQSGESKHTIVQLTAAGKAEAERSKGVGRLGAILDVVEDDGPCSVQHVATKSELTPRAVYHTVKERPDLFSVQ